jgi:4-alpha-glucanotransferase
MATDPWGIEDGYWDVAGTWHATSPRTRAALRAAMGRDDAHAPPPGRAIRVVRAGVAEPLPEPCELVLEDGSEVRAADALPPDLPVGYHDLRRLDGRPLARLIVSPGRCHLPADLRDWLLAVQLPACRSWQSWGIGDLADLRAIGDWAAQRGAGMVAVSPLHAAVAIDRVEPSPYSPSSRRWIDPLLLRVDALPGTGRDPTVVALAAEARRLNTTPLVDRDAVWDLKCRALERVWATQGPDPGFARWRAEQGDELETFARFCALAEHHRSAWSAWPSEHRHPSRPAVGSFAAAHAGRVAFWAWVQYLLAGQLRRAREPLPLLSDLAVGVDPDGADAWAQQDLLAMGIHVGAPPDEFNPAGQDWGLPPFVPHALRDAAYRPLASLWRAAMAHGGGMRVDHVMGLSRLFWIPPGGGPTDGAYVRYRADELLAVLAIESVRAGAVVVGEDLGTVEDEVRHTLADAGVLSYRLVWFEDAPPEHYPVQALAAVTTHDLPTIAGVWSGSDAADQRAAGVDPDEAALDRLRAKLVKLSGLPGDAAVDDVIVAVHARLASAPSALVAATLEDGLAIPTRPNLPGTTGEQRPNWSRALPVELGDALAAPLMDRVADALARSPIRPTGPHRGSGPRPGSRARWRRTPG